MVLKQLLIICLMVTIARPNPDPCSEPQPGPLRGRRSPRPQFCPDLSEAGVYCRGKIETGTFGNLTRGTLTKRGAVKYVKSFFYIFLWVSYLKYFLTFEL